MDALSISIIVIATVAAILFKVILFKRIRQWADQDLLKSLANQNPDKLAYLTKQYDALITEKTPRKVLHEKLSELAANYPVEK